MSSTDTARALVLDGPRVLRAVELPVPEVGDDDAVLRIEACGLCGTDHEQFDGALPLPGSFIPGHEVVGTIDAIGDGARQRWGVARGDRVAVAVFQSCGQCRACARGDLRRCHRHGLADMYGFVPLSRAPGLWGGYASHLYLSPDAVVMPVPSSLTPEVATLFNPLGAGIRWGVTVPGTRPGAVVAVLGPGVRGLAVAAAAKAAGAGHVMVTGKGPADNHRLELATRFGADSTVDVADREPVAALLDAAGRLADVVVDVTARAPEALAQAVALARPGGTVVLAGTRGSRETPGFHPDHIVYKELKVQGALGVDVEDYRQALDLLAAGAFPFDAVPRRCAGLDPGAMSDLLATMGGTGGERPVHAVMVP